MPFRSHHTIGGCCPICEEERQIEIGRQLETIRIRNKDIQINAHVERCTTCNEIFATTEEEEKNIQEAYRKYRHEAKLLQPKEIRVIREKYGLSQKSFALLLGCGEVTLHRYESGALQDEAHNILLLLLKNPENFSTIFDRNLHRLTPKQVQKVQEKLPQLLYLTMDSFATPVHADSYADNWKGRSNIQDRQAVNSAASEQPLALAA